MAVFKNFFNKMTYGFVALFLLSFAIGAMESTTSTESPTDSDCNIMQYLKTDSYTDSAFNIMDCLVSSSNPSIMSGGAEKPKFDIEIQERELYKEGKKVIFQVRNDQEPINNTNFITQELRILSRSLQYIHDCTGLEDEEGCIAMMTASAENKLFLNSSHFNWNNFKLYLKTSTAFSGVVGEVASQVFFDHLGYTPLKDYQVKKTITYDDRIYSSEQPLCNTQDTSNRGIDFIFVSKEEDTKFRKGALDKFSHVIINEAKFRGDKVSISESGFHTTKHYLPDGQPHDSWRNRQAHSFWNRYNFYKTQCVSQGLGNYDEQSIIRTVTLLNQDGHIRLYEVRDAVDDISYPSSSLDYVRKTCASQIYTPFKQNIAATGYTLH